MECGTPVPPEVLEEGGLPGRSGEQSESAEKTSFFGEQSDEKLENAAENVEAAEKTEEKAEGGDVQASMPGIQPIGGSDEGTLVFCPNCGMRMQQNTEVCEKCGMRLGNKPAHTVPLINNNPMDLDGGFGGFGGGIGGFSDSDISQLNNFMGGGMSSAYGNSADNLFGTNSYSASDIEALNRQMSNFSASSSEMPAISKTSGGVRQKEPEQGEARKVEDFSMSDGSDESVPIADDSVPVIEGCSMDENPDADVSLDPYTFLGNSMDDFSEERPVDTVNLFGEPTAEAAEEEAPAADEEPAAEEEAPAADEEPAAEEEAPAAVEEPAAEEEAPAADEEPTAEEEAPAAAEEPAAEEEAPAADEEPAAEEEAPAAAEEPAAEEEAPAAAEEPAAEEEAPAADEEPTNFFGGASVPAEEPDDFIPEEMGFIAESAPVISEEAEEPAAPAPAAVAVERREVEDFDFRRPQKPQNNVPKSSSEEETPKGNLVYCRTCGQDMYDTEKFCKNCGATYKGAYVPPKFAPSNSGGKEAPMVFGKIPLGKFVGGIVGLCVAAAFVLFILQPWKKNPQEIVGGDTSSSTSASSTSTSTVQSTTESGNVTPSTSSVKSTSTDTDSTSTDNEPASTSTESTSSTSSTTSSSKTSTSTNPVVNPTTDAKFKSLEQDRKKIMSAAETIAGEVGKMEMLSQNVLYAMNNSTKSNEEAIQSFYESRFATTTVNLLKTGKSSVERAVRMASPTNSELSALYTSLNTLKSRYDDYYNFIISPKGGYSAFTKNCKSYYTRVTSAISGLSLNKFAANYSTANQNSAYKDMVSAAITDIRNSADKFTTLQTQLSGLGTTFERKAFSTLTTNLSTYADAAGYAMKAKAYAIMLKGVSSSYSAAADHIDSAYTSLNKLVEACSKLPKTSSDSFISSSRIAISNARSYANRAASAIN